MYALGRFHNYVSAFLAELNPPPPSSALKIFFKGFPSF